MTQDTNQQNDQSNPEHQKTDQAQDNSPGTPPKTQITDNGGDRITKLIQERDEYKQLLQRERADFVNFKERAEKEKKEFITFGEIKMLQNLLSCYENLQRAVQQVPENLKDDEWVKGVLQTNTIFQTTFQSINLEKIKTVGEPFDSTRHEAMMQTDGPADIIMQELDPGYIYRDTHIVKPAKVSVGNGNSPSAEKQT